VDWKNLGVWGVKTGFWVFRGGGKVKGGEGTRKKTPTQKTLDGTRGIVAGRNHKKNGCFHKPRKTKGESQKLRHQDVWPSSEKKDLVLRRKTRPSLTGKK